jgi:outer membrane biosynthesis protein TonB
MDRNDRRKLAKAWPALGALGLAFTLGATAAAAQTGRGWVDPPANLKPPQNAAPSSGPAETVTNPPAPKAETPTPAKAAASEKPAEAAKPAIAEKPAPEKPAVAEKPAPEKSKVAEKLQRQQRAVASRQTETKRKTAARPERSSRRTVASRATPRGAPVAEARELEVMRLRTIEYPDGRRVQILTEIERDDGLGWPFR